jgi:hypothetical protein
MAPVLADLRATDGPAPLVADTEWTDDVEHPSAMLWSPEGSGTGIRIRLADGQADRVAHAADQVQEWAIEELWRSSATNWPTCPSHPDTHPLAATVVDGVASWVCPHDRTPIAVIGLLT